MAVGWIGVFSNCYSLAPRRICLIVGISQDFVQDQAEGPETATVGADEFGWIWGVTFDGKPNITVEDIFVDPIRPGEVHFLEFLGPIPLSWGESAGGCDTLGQGHVDGQRGVGSEVRNVREAIE